MRRESGIILIVILSLGDYMVSLTELVRYLNEMLTPDQFSDYCPNGLQIEGRPQVKKIVGAVTASHFVVDFAIRAQADAILVHHGYFWRSEDPTIRGAKRTRLKSLLCHDVSLLAYHLPLDAHPVFGNNAQLGHRLGLTCIGRFGPAGNKDIVMLGALNPPLTAAQFSARISAALGRVPLLLGDPSKIIERVAWCTGGAQNYFELALTQHVDAFLTGEVSEPSYHIARESGTCFFSAGHHATERYGVQALGKQLTEQFQLEFEFVDEENPV